MIVTKAFFQTAGVVGIVLVSLTVGAQELKKDSRTFSTTISVADGPSLPTTAKRKTAPKVAPARATAAAEVVDMGRLEMITERYPDGKVKVEREVGQDAAGNYINQGTFKVYAPSGEVIKSGEFLNGKKQGKWTQLLARDDGHLFSASQDKQWSGPFTSEVTFQDNRLHGTWTIKDSHGQTVIQWCFDNGTRSGTWTWWNCNSQKHLEATYVNGALNGAVLEWDHDGKIVSQNTYIDGKCVVKTVGWYTLGQKRYEGTYLRASDMPEATYDWWNSRILTLTAPAASTDLQQGLWTEWYPSGSKKTEAQYDRGVAVGKITWWYENGQQQAEGEFEAGKRSGTWITWHANGLKESLVEYKAGKRATKMLTWSSEGSLLESRQGQQAIASRLGQGTSATR